MGKTGSRQQLKKNGPDQEIDSRHTQVLRSLRRGTFKVKGWRKDRSEGNIKKGKKGERVMPGFTHIQSQGEPSGAETAGGEGEKTKRKHRHKKNAENLETLVMRGTTKRNKPKRSGGRDVWWEKKSSRKGVAVAAGPQGSGGNLIDKRKEENYLGEDEESQKKESLVKMGINLNHLSTHIGQSHKLGQENQKKKGQKIVKGVTRWESSKALAAAVVKEPSQTNQKKTMFLGTHLQPSTHSHKRTRTKVGRGGKEDRGTRKREREEGGDAQHGERKQPFLWGGRP